MKIMCITCLQISDVVGYHKDNPILDCGHINICKDTDESLDEICKDIIIRAESLQQDGMSFGEAMDIIIEEDGELSEKIKMKREEAARMNGQII